MDLHKYSYSKDEHRSLARRVLLSPTIYVIVLVLFLAGWLTQWMASNDPASLREAFGLSAIAVTLPVHVVLAMTPFPADLMAIANGAVYGLLLGTVLSCLGWWFAALLQYGLGRRARADFDLENNTSRIPGWLKQFPVDHPLYLICCRQVPWLGMHIGSFVPGAAGVGLRRFAWCSAIGVIPGSLLMTAIGAGLIQLR